MDYLIPILVDNEIWNNTEKLTESVVRNEERDELTYSGDNSVFDATSINQSGRLVDAEIKEFIKRYADDVQKTVPGVTVVIIPGDFKE